MAVRGSREGRMPFQRLAGGQAVESENFLSPGPPTLGAPGNVGGSGSGVVPSVYNSDSYWTTNKNPASWFAPANDTYGPYDVGPPADPTLRAVWQTPLFDLRAGLKDRSGYQGNAQNIGASVMLGTYFALYFQIDGLTAAVQTQTDTVLKWYAYEGGDVYQPATNLFYTDRQDITVDVNSGDPVSGRSVIRFVPRGNIRYWQVAIVLDYINVGVGPDDPPNVYVSGALH